MTDPDWTPEEWHRTAIADTGTSHVLRGRQYVVTCEWCPAVCYGPTKEAAMLRFRTHEANILDSRDEGTTPGGTDDA